MSNFNARELLTQSARYLLYKPSPRDILWLNYAITYRCNSRCKMCFIWKRYKRQPSLANEELDITTVEELVRSELFIHLAGISFTGGEPFLRKDFVDIVSLFVHKHPRAVYGIATNGLNPNLTVSGVREIEFRCKPRHLNISVSLDGVLSKHDELRGVPGAFTSVCTTLERLKSETSANIGVDFTITPWNYRQLLAVFNYAREHKVQFVTCFAHHSDLYYGNSDIRFEWNENDYAEIENALNGIVRDKIISESPWKKIVDPYAFFFSSCTSFERDRVRSHACHSGTHSMFLDPYGNVYPCLLLDRKVGNIKEQEFESLWLSAEANALRADIRSGSCGCWLGCEAIPSMLRNVRFVKWNLKNKFQLASWVK